MGEKIIYPVKKLSGQVVVPADKSISHRALLLSSIAKGESVVENLLESADVLSTLNCLSQIGVSIIKRDSKYYIEGVGKFGFKSSGKPLNVGNSGTTLRMLPGILAGQDFKTTLVGDSSVSARPVERVLKPLRMMGARADSIDGHAPVTINGNKLSAINYHTEVPSAQVKSAILLAGLLADGKTVVAEDYKSRDHTELMLKSFGADLKVNGNKVTVSGNNDLLPQTIKVPGDFSSAAFFIAAGILVKDSHLKLENVGINPNRVGMAYALRRMGYDILAGIDEKISGGEKVADLNVVNHELKAANIEKAEIPSLIDELPVIAVLATQASGQTVVSGAEELRVKETDRIYTVVNELKKMGAQIKEKKDGFIIKGPVKLKGSTVDSHGDHRLAMALSVAGLIAEGKTIIKQANAVNISFPGYFKVLESILAPSVRT